MMRGKQLLSVRGKKIWTLAFIMILAGIACRFTASELKEPAYQETIAVQGTRIANLSTQVAKQEKDNQSQWGIISHLATQMPYALDLITPIPGDVTITPTPFPKCTPPPCEEGEVYHCPDECPGGCGTTCATPTPGG